MFDWDAAEEVLYRISTEQVARFLGQIGVDEVYGFGFFCNPAEGIMLVANTREHLEANIGGNTLWRDPADAEESRWISAIGNILLGPDDLRETSRRKNATSMISFEKNPANRTNRVAE